MAKKQDQESKSIDKIDPRQDQKAKEPTAHKPSEPQSSRPAEPAKVYPRILYRPDYPDGVIMRSPEHEASLGDGWVESPALFPKDQAKA